MDPTGPAAQLEVMGEAQKVPNQGEPAPDGILD